MRILAAFLCFVLCISALSNPAIAKFRQKKINNSALPVTPGMALGPLTGNILTCVGSPSADPYIQHFTISGGHLTGAITATAPTGFEVSPAAGSGYGHSVTLAASAGVVSQVIIYVRSAAGDSPGKIAGKVVLSSAGAATQTVLVTGTINPLPKIDPVTNQTVASNSSTAAVNFTGSGNYFTWTNNTPSIGLATSGNGNIGSFMAENFTASPVTATITVTPKRVGVLYVANQQTNMIDVINTVTNNIIAAIPVKNSPMDVSASPDGSRVYVATYDPASGDPGSVAVINTFTNTIVANIPLTGQTGSIVTSFDGKTVYVTDAAGLAVIDAKTNTLLKNIPFTYGLGGLALGPDGSELYVSGESLNASSLTVINTAANTVSYSIPAPSSPYNDIAVSPDGNKIYVADLLNKTVSIINTPTSTTVGTITLSIKPVNTIISPDGTRLYLTDDGAKIVSIVDLTTNKEIADLPATGEPDGIAISPDGKTLYVINNYPNSVDVFDTQTYKLITTLNDETAGSSFTQGNYLIPATNCPGIPTTFTITVLPRGAVPSFTTSPASGVISACSGIASASPNLQQFTVSGSNLTTSVTATAPTGFEVSLTADGGYGNTVLLNQSQGTLTPTTVYVRAAADNVPGAISGNVILSFPGLPSQNVAVSATINASPTIDPVPNQTLTNGSTTTTINFTGTNYLAFNWVNDTPGIGLPATGSGNINPFTAINTGNLPLIATITVTPTNTTRCNGVPAIFNITVDPTVTFTASDDLSPLTTIYGTSSAPETFTVSGTNISSGILITPPAGFEVSSNGITYNTTTTITDEDISLTRIYIRLAATTPVGTYSGNITLSTSYAANVTLTVPNSEVTPAPLTVTADNKDKIVGDANPPLTVTYTGFVNNDGPAQLTKLPDLSTTATTISPIGQYPITASGVTAPNYSFNYISGLLTIKPVLSALFIPNTFTPNSDGRNDTWEINGLQYYPQATVNVFNRWGQKVFTSTGYPIPWDGRYNGTMLPSATYYYIINPKNGQPLISGWVMIIK